MVLEPCLFTVDRTGTTSDRECVTGHAQKIDDLKKLLIEINGKGARVTPPLEDNRGYKGASIIEYVSDSDPSL